MTKKVLKASMAEAIGTFILVFFGCASVIINTQHNNIFGLQGIALAFGLVVLAVVYCLGHVSEAHINPAVTIALASTKKFPWSHVPIYILAQLVGATLASLCLSITLAHGGPLGGTMPTVGVMEALLIEIILTALLLFVVMGAATDERAFSGFAPIAISAVIIVDVLVGGSITGASMNPARSFGPALVMMDFTNLWIYFAGPIIGALVGAWAYKLCATP